MKFRYDESFLFPQGQEDFGRGLMFPQGQLSGSFEKMVYQNRFLFPAGGTDTDHGETLMFPQGKLHGFGRIADENIPYVTTKFGAQNLYLNADQVAAALSQYPDTPVDANGDLLRSNWIRFYISKVFPNPTTDYDKRARAEYEQIIADLVAYEQTPQAKALIASASSTAAAQDRAYYEASEARAKQENAARAAAEAAAAEAARQAAAQQASAQAQADAAARQAAAQADAVAKAAAATANAQAVQAVIDAQLKAQQAAATAAADAEMRAQQTVSFSLDADAEGTMFLVGKRGNGSTYVVSTGAGNIDEYLKKYTKQTRFDLAQTAAYVKAEKADAAVAAAAASTHKTAVDTSTATVQHVDTASGTTSTVNAQTGSVRLTLSDGTTATGTGSVTAGGITTTVNPTTGVVTTQNANTGVATQTNAATGQTQTAVQITGTAATGGTFMLPGGATVTTTQPITATGLSAGHIALAALLGVLLLRGAVR